eukprot:gnl/Chilomastix_cuspidata/2190.p1 GENE.gnl/Chilomastix_cuspidata/2190~~gnl/Chilomastix_cuspidata/2190.p1  ORF type:complete len:256 (-),score=113.42 gnl/Chilomastix_cuspidata/2190:248-1015(-)
MSTNIQYVINDFPDEVRAALMRRSVIETIEAEFKVNIVAKGTFIPPDTPKAPGQMPLYLDIALPHPSVGEKVVEYLEGIKATGIIPSAAPRAQEEGARVFIPFNPPPNFRVVSRLVGRRGNYVKWITAKTGCHVSVKGRGAPSGHLAHAVEDGLPLHLSILPSRRGGPELLARAVEYAHDLVACVREEYAEWQLPDLAPHEFAHDGFAQDAPTSPPAPRDEALIHEFTDANYAMFLEWFRSLPEAERQQLQETYG